MSRNLPPELDTSINQQVLKCLDGLSAHSDVAEALTTALEPLGDVQIFCPDSRQYLYVVASTNGVIFAFAVGMNTTCFRLDERMKSRALHDWCQRLSLSSGVRAQNGKSHTARKLHRFLPTGSGVFQSARGTFCS